MPRRNPLLLTLLVAVTIFGLITFSRSFEAGVGLESIQRVEEPAKVAAPLDQPGSSIEQYSNPVGNDYESHSEQGDHPESPDLLSTPEFSVESLAVGKPIMGKMPNQTTRALVGNAGWKLLHTILSQYPEEPTSEQRATLETFIKLFSRVYPCQECATHFQELLKTHPPQLSSRKTAAMWGCNAHNVVNRRLGKEEFDCANIFDQYDCGCGDQPADGPLAGEVDDDAGKHEKAKGAKDSVETEEIEKARVVEAGRAG